MARVLMYATRFCPFCVMARRLLKAKGVGIDEIAVDGNAARRAEMRERSGCYTVPQIWIGDRHVGGYEEIFSLDRSGELDRLLKDAQRSG
jgi:glutaredoxin 3